MDGSTAGQRLHVGGAILAAIGALLLVLAANGVGPGYAQDNTATVLTEGPVRCLEALGWSLPFENCRAMGGAAGFPLLTNGPVVVLGALLAALPGVDAGQATSIAVGVVFVIAWLGAAWLGVLLGLPRAVAAFAATLYLVSPTVVGLQQFPGTGAGFAVLPAAMALDVWASRRSTATRRFAVTVLMLVAARTTMLFLDGYAFLALTLFALAWWPLRTPGPLRSRAIALAGMAGATAVAVVLYRRYVPIAFDPGPLEIFRAMGLDMSTLARPSPSVLGSQIWGDRTPQPPLWGDGSNVLYNFVGLAALVLALAGLAARRRDRDVLVLTAVGVLAFVLAIGPSLKINERTSAPLSTSPAYSTYLMPEGLAAVDLPWGGAFTAIPGLDSTRATYRWFGVTRLVLCLLVGAALAALLRRRRGPAIALALGLLVLLETGPDLGPLGDRHRYAHDVLTALRDGGADLDAMTSRDERVFFLSADTEFNDFAVNLLAPIAGVRAFNVGGDKNGAIARPSWPGSVQALTAPDVGADQVVAALLSREVDVVVAPRFDLREAAYRFPPPPEAVSQFDARWAPVLADPRLRVTRGTYMSAVRLRS